MSSSDAAQKYNFVRLAWFIMIIMIDHDNKCFEKTKINIKLLIRTGRSNHKSASG